MTCLKEALLWAQKHLLSSCVSTLTPEEALKTARLYLGHTLQKDPSYFYGFSEDIISSKDFKTFQNFIEKACQGIPFSRILQKREFWSLSFELNDHTLDPRPESEHLIEHALKILSLENKMLSPLHILDLGTGSGCLLLSLLSELPFAKGIGVDLSFDAAACAAKNAQLLNLSHVSSFIQGFWTDSIVGKFDVILSNPPYIPTGDIPLLDRGVREFDPILALDGGIQGLNPYFYILPRVKTLLSPEGILLIEIGSTQASSLEKLLLQEKFQDITLHHDLEGRPRLFSARNASLF